METKMEVMNKLRKKGFNFRLLGSWFLMEAIALIAEEEQPLLLTKVVYPDIAENAGTKWQNVERNIRTALRAAGVEEDAGTYIMQTAMEVMLHED